MQLVKCILFTRILIFRIIAMLLFQTVEVITRMLRSHMNALAGADVSLQRQVLCLYIINLLRSFLYFKTNRMQMLNAL